MKCELMISLYCNKVFRKDKAKYINGKVCCANCMWMQHQINKGKRDVKDKK